MADTGNSPIVLRMRMLHWCRFRPSMKCIPLTVVDAPRAETYMEPMHVTVAHASSILFVADRYTTYYLLYSGSQWQNKSWSMDLQVQPLVQEGGLVVRRFRLGVAFRHRLMQR